VQNNVNQWVARWSRHSQVGPDPKKFGNPCSMQYGFRQRHSTEMALIKIRYLITNAIDNKKCSVGIFIDLAKAFDTVDYDILIKKLTNYGIRGTLLMWFKSYLEGRYQQLQCNGALSEHKLISYGVPQGSNLGAPRKSTPISTLY